MSGTGLWNTPPHRVPRTQAGKGSTTLFLQHLECVASQSALAQKKHVSLLLTFPWAEFITVPQFMEKETKK